MFNCAITILSDLLPDSNQQILMKNTLAPSFKSALAKRNFCIGNVLHFVMLCLLAFHVWALNCGFQDRDMARNGGAELLEIVGMDS